MLGKQIRGMLFGMGGHTKGDGRFRGHNTRVRVHNILTLSSLAFQWRQSDKVKLRLRWVAEVVPASCSAWRGPTLWGRCQSGEHRRTLTRVFYLSLQWSHYWSQKSTLDLGIDGLA